ncbi:MAG: pyridoxal-phosphate dependent enzyme [Armatimonadetes bacterium]|nr:pyridoxal-phosphate dependent enzyme [Armatimonadota bacterium]
MLTLDDIVAARRATASRLHRTPMLRSSTLAAMTGTDLLLKAECFQKTGSFKPRGVLNKIRHLSPEEKQRGLITFSAGNHAQAVAYAAAAEGIPATVVMPAAAVRSKVEAARGYGAEVVLHGEMTQIFARAEELRRERNLTFVHPFDDPIVIAGQGTVGLEILDEVPDLRVAVVPVGGGGLISGIAAALKLSRPDVRVYGVEPMTAAAMAQSLAAGRPVRLEQVRTVADGLAAPFAGEHTYALVSRFVDGIITVPDDAIVRAMRLVMERCKVVVEPAGAAGVAALLSGQIPEARGARTVCVLSGGNVDLDQLRTLLGA